MTSLSRSAQLLTTAAATFVIGGLLVLAACESATGPDAPDRRNGCIDRTCNFEGGAQPATSSSGGNANDPFEGVSKVATLVKGGFRFTEGPVWIGGKLLFTDVPANTILELAADGTTTTPFRTQSGGANGLAVDPGGNLVMCEGGAKRVSRGPGTKGGQIANVANTHGEAGFNAPNDVVVRSDGTIYFTDPIYSGEATQDDEAVYRVATDGTVSRLGHDFAKPNGIALSPDGNTLYVADNGAGKLLSATVDGSGAVGSFAVIADVPGGDGMAVDDRGNLYVADNLGIDVLTSGGQKVGIVTIPVKASNCTFGSEDRRTLFITANGPERAASTGLYSVRMGIPGLP